jgi:hypothetical protein
MAEVTGDDVDAFIKTSKQKGSIPEEFDVPFAHTPALVGSHITGYDNALMGVLRHFWDGKAKTTEPLVRVPDDSINFIGGFDGFVVGNMKESCRRRGKRICFARQRTVTSQNSVHIGPVCYVAEDVGHATKDAPCRNHAKAKGSPQSRFQSRSTVNG